MRAQPSKSLVAPGVVATSSVVVDQSPFMRPTHIKLLVVAVAVVGVVGAVIAPWNFYGDADLIDAVNDLDGQWVDRPAPEFDLPDRQGRTHSLSQYRGQVVFLNFWASFCEPCREEMPSMESLVRQYRDQGLTMVAISVDSGWNDVDRFMASFLPGERSAMTVLLNESESTMHRYGTEMLPETYIIDRDGRMVARFVGAYDWSRPEIRQIIEGLL